jgi:hypothetical protein
VGIGKSKSRASELMQIADGRKTVQEVRAASQARKPRKPSPLQSGEEPPAVPDDRTPSDRTEGSWRVLATDVDGRTWSNAIRVGSRLEAMFCIRSMVNRLIEDGVIATAFQMVEAPEEPNGFYVPSIDTLYVPCLALTRPEVTLGEETCSLN